MRIDQITITRFVAAFSIIVYHHNASIWPFNAPFVKTLFLHANLGVSYFFVLSGFVMIVAYNREVKLDYSNFYLNRFARIYPIYILSLLLVMPYIFIKHKFFTLSSFILSTACLQAWVPNFALRYNQPLWSISVEVLFYFLFPLLFNTLYKKCKLKHLIIVTLLLWSTSQMLFNSLYFSPFYRGYPSDSHNFLYYFPLLHLNEFIIGNIAGLCLLKWASKKGNYDLALMGIISLIAVIIYNNDVVNMHNGAIAILFAVFLILLSLNISGSMKLLRSKFAIFLGEISFSMYILQVPLAIYLNYILQKAGSTSITFNFYLYLLVLLAMSSVSYLYVEIPMRALIKRIGSNQGKGYQLPK